MRPLSPPGPDRDGLRLSGTPLAEARRILVTVPGALTRLDAFDPLTENLPSGTALAELAFPGLDGRPLQGRVRMRPAARLLAKRLNAAPARRIDLVGISAGAGICLELRGLLTCPDVTLAAIAAPAPFPDLLATTMGMSSDLWRIRRAHPGADWPVIWYELFQVLMFGRDTPRPKLTLDDRGRPTGPSVTPTARMLFSHGSGVAFWRPSARAMQADTPLRFFHGSHDTVSPSAGIARLAARMENADARWYRDRGHLPHIMNPQLFADIRRFWLYRGKTES
ncbi:alpha/beta fold hydrolase [Marinibacterium profundimaris]|uniref:Uncharacterized protein n=1 Tax=Marinibacterium profundimaris TaxID=1679460 RepID=A0A225NHX1_9RHOB|nr:alpha/beta hydrolase [Marinibacterium profundimaris]OWU72554.1 hypothetical protein ATO3_15890 [Marinibacterium profundimaris]